MFNQSEPIRESLLNQLKTIMKKIIEASTKIMKLARNAKISNKQS